MKVYGIPNCNTVKKSFDWLKNEALQFEFHDFKKKGITEDKLAEWVEAVGWQKLVNKKGTTWRSLSPNEQQKVTNERSAIALMLDKTSVIKRPVIEVDGKVIVGFDEEEYRQILRQQ